MTSYLDQEQIGAAGKIRNQPLSPQMAALLNTVGQQAGVYFDVQSGGQSDVHSASTYKQPGGWTGSTRHDDGNAADVKAYTLNSDGSKHYLDFTNPSDQGTWANVVKLAAANGATGIGAGEGYMGGQTVHIGFGAPATWGDGESSTTTPAWLKTAYDSGRTIAANPSALAAINQVSPTASQPATGGRLAGAPSVASGLAYAAPPTMMPGRPAALDAVPQTPYVRPTWAGGGTTTSNPRADDLGSPLPPPDSHFFDNLGFLNNPPQHLTDPNYPFASLPPPNLPLNGSPTPQAPYTPPPFAWGKTPAPIAPVPMPGRPASLDAIPQAPAPSIPQPTSAPQYATLPNGKLIATGTFPSTSNPGTIHTITRGPNGEAVFSTSNPGLMNTSKMGAGTVAGGMVGKAIGDAAAAAAPVIQKNISQAGQTFANAGQNLATEAGSLKDGAANLFGNITSGLGNLFGGGKPSAPSVPTPPTSAPYTPPAFNWGKALPPSQTASSEPRTVYVAANGTETTPDLAGSSQMPPGVRPNVPALPSVPLPSKPALTPMDMSQGGNLPRAPTPQGNPPWLAPVVPTPTPLPYTPPAFNWGKAPSTSLTPMDMSTGGISIPRPTLTPMDTSTGGQSILSPMDMSYGGIPAPRPLPTIPHVAGSIAGAPPIPMPNPSWLAPVQPPTNTFMDGLSTMFNASPAGHITQLLTGQPVQGGLLSLFNKAPGSVAPPTVSVPSRQSSYITAPNGTIYDTDKSGNMFKTAL